MALDWTGVTPTPRAERILAAAIADARARGHSYLGTEHLLLALAGDANGIAGQVLDELGTRERTAARVAEIMGSDGYATPAEGQGG